MPLLRNKPFVKNPVPRGLSNLDEVFYCKLTKEIFPSYEDFLNRLTLCNSRVWSCKQTGLPNMTYREALDCERKNKTILKHIPNGVQKPILYLINLTRCFYLEVLVEQIFNYVRYRYFVSEIVEIALESDIWLKCRIVAVYSLYSDSNHQLTTPNNSSAAISLYNYDVQPINYIKKKQNPNNEVVYRVNGAEIQRSKGGFTKDRCRFFITHNVEFKNGLIILKDSKANSIANLKFEDIFSGEIPTFFQARKIFSEEAYHKNLLKMLKEGNEEKINMKKKKKEAKEKLSKFVEDQGN